MIKIAILADIHANLPAFQAVLADAKMRGCHQVYHAGDLITIGPYPAEVVDLAMSTNLISVQGNHEAWVDCGLPLDPIPEMSDEELMHQHWTHSRLDKCRRDYIRNLPIRIIKTLQDVRLYIVHFALDDNENTFKAVNPRWSDNDILALFDDVDADLVCFGHLHNRQFNQRYKGRYFLNPGSAGCNYDSVAPYAIVDLSGGMFSVEHHEVPYDRSVLLARYDSLEIPARNTLRRIFLGVNLKEE